MNTEQLKYFMEFAFYGTAEKTAAQLGVSRYSVSRNIKNWKKSWEVNCLLRGFRELFLPEKETFV